MPRKHHTPSEKCMEATSFVTGVCLILENQLSNTWYGEFYKVCTDHGYPPGKIPKRIIENEMLCGLMCCCEEHPAKGETNKVHQICVKDILDDANKLIRGKKVLPRTQFLAELAMNVTQKEVNSGRMNLGGTKRNPGDKLNYQDVVILVKKPSTPTQGKGEIVLDDIERIVEMKFSSEPQDIKNHVGQISDYSIWKKEITVMTVGDGPQDVTPAKVTRWACKCDSDNKRKKRMITADAVEYSPAENMQRRSETVTTLLSIWAIFFPAGGSAVKGLGTLGKIPLPAGI